MFQIQKSIESITNKLAIIAHEVELKSSLNLTDINVHAEYFFCGLLNLIYGYSLVNANAVTSNAQAIDLIDVNERIAIQVTSTSEFKKIRKTIDGFITSYNINKVDRVIVLILTKKKAYKLDVYGSNFKINIKEDVWDYKDLIKRIYHLPVDKVKEISEYLELHITTEKEKKDPKEVITILGMIEVLSNETHPMVGNGYLDDPNPGRKINIRFAMYAEYLMGIYISLISSYAGILFEINRQSDTGTLNINKTAAYLKRFSDSVLDDCNGDPVKALNKMTIYYASKLEQKGIDYDDSAIQYYLIDHMIRCNVFPNKASTC